MQTEQPRANPMDALAPLIALAMDPEYHARLLEKRAKQAQAAIPANHGKRAQAR